MNPLLMKAVTVALTVVAAGAAAIAVTQAGPSASAEQPKPPEAPIITARPPSPTTVHSATFAFRSAERGVELQCRIGDGAFAPCASPKTYRGVGLGEHAFEVRAVSASGSASAVQSYRWSVQRTVSGFSVTGDVTRPLAPGGSVQVDVAISNPYPGDLVVREIVLIPEPATTVAGKPNPRCDGSVNLAGTPYLGAPVTVKPNQLVTLSDLGVDPTHWPRLAMRNLPVNQDACKGARFTARYSARADKM